MKKIIMALIIILFGSFMAVSMAFATADTWTQKADLGGVGRVYAVGFSIGNKGYIGTGGIATSMGSYQAGAADFWEYDPVANTWTQKADYGGGGREGAFGFSIGNKGYIGTGSDGTWSHKDFWAYDPNENTWTQMKDYPGKGIHYDFGISIGDKGYAGMGGAKDFWEYDPTTNTWTQKKDFPGTTPYLPKGFSIGEKGYLASSSGSAEQKKDFWEYDPDADTWTQKSGIGGTAKLVTFAFSVGNKGYVGTGVDWKPAATPKYFFEYDPATDTWTEKAYPERIATGGGIVGFSIGNKGYMGTGKTYDSSTYKFTYYRDFWEYEPAENSAVLIEKDLFATGDGLITHDTISGLDWLDVSLTVNQNYDEVRTGIWYQRGFRHATREEIEDLFIHAGTPDDNFDPAVTYPEETLALMNLLGTTGGSRTYGLCGTDFLGDLITLESHPIGVRFSALLGKLDYLSFGTILLGEAHFSQGHPFSDEKSPNYGSFLVREPGDATPDQFTFNYEVDVDLNTVITSNTITVTGISVPAPISVTGGTYSINGDTYTDENGTVNNGDKVTVQQTSSGSYMTTTEATLTIGGVSDTFSVTTKEASVITLSPVANKTVLWPPNNKMVLITIKANASDSSGGPVTLKAAVSCNESASLGRDWTKPVINQKKGFIVLSLRATRNGSGTGRIYTITITATGKEGNSATQAVTVTVPHDQRNKVRR